MAVALDQLLDRASDVGEISVRAVAERAGVGIGSLYDYFNGQEGLFTDLIVRMNQANFEKLRAVVEQTQGQPVEQALRVFLDEAVDTYLGNPRRTRAILGLIARVGMMSPVIRERDRFAQVIVRRIRDERPELEEAEVERSIRVVFDAVIGLVIAELWRPTPNVKEDILGLADAIVGQQLGIHLLAGPRPSQRARPSAASSFGMKTPNR